MKNLSYISYIQDGECKSEDRLTLAFCATFEHSLEFRGLFLQFLKLNNKNDIKNINIKNLEINDKVAGDTKNKIRRIPDIEIYQDEKLIIRIENKLGLKLTSDQLDQYDTLKKKSRIKLAFVKHSFQFGKKYKKWNIYYWSDLHRYFGENFHKVKNEKDKFLILEFLKYMENKNLNFIFELEKHKIQSFANFIIDSHEILSGKSRKNPVSLKNLDVFQAGQDLLSFFERIIVESKPDFRDAVERNYSFTPYLGIGGKNEVWLTAGVWNIKKKYKNYTVDNFGIGLRILHNKQIKISSFICDNEWGESDNSFWDETKPFTFPSGKLKFERVLSVSTALWSQYLK